MATSSETAPPAQIPEAGAADVVIITAALEPHGLEVTGIVTGQTDPTGVCVLTVSNRGIARSVEATVNPAGENSYCPLMLIPRDELSSGSWEVSLEYRAAELGGRSAPVTVEVP